MSNTYFSWGLEKPSGDVVLYSGDFVYGKIRHAPGGKFLATCHNVPGNGRKFYTKAAAMEWIEHHFNAWDAKEVTA